MRDDVRTEVSRDRIPSNIAAWWNRTLLLGLPLATIALVPGLAQACAVCFSGRSDETREAFISTTAFMTFLPLLLIGGVTWYLRRRFLAIQAQERVAELEHIDLVKGVSAD